VTQPQIDASTNLADLTFDGDPADSTSVALLSVTRPVSASRTPAHEPTHFIGSDVYAAGNVTLSVAAFYPYAEGQAFRLWGRVTYADGRLSPWAYADGLAVA
jgi:hypothetical protein